MKFPGSLEGNYRYAYQGQEKDTETQMEAFELRLWDGRIGRWLTVDPYGQHHSPYMGMGNNPIVRIDPDGGADCPNPPCNPQYDTALINDINPINLDLGEFGSSSNSSPSLLSLLLEHNPASQLLQKVDDYLENNWSGFGQWGSNDVQDAPSQKRGQNSVFYGYRDVSNFPGAFATRAYNPNTVSVWMKLMEGAQDATNAIDITERNYDAWKPIISPKDAKEIKKEAYSKDYTYDLSRKILIEFTKDTLIFEGKEDKVNQQLDSLDKSNNNIKKNRQDFWGVKR